jgi:hypothetical protein
MKQHVWADQVGLDTLLEAYQLLAGTCLIPGLVLAALAGAGWLVARRARGAPSAARATPGASPWLSAAALTLVFMPVFIWVLAAVYTNAATVRYTIAAVAGFAWIAGEGVLVLERLGKVGRRAAWAAPLVVLTVGLVTMREEVAASGEVPVPAEVLGLVTQSARPIAVDSPLLFLQAFHGLPPGAQQNLVYLVDRAASRRHLGFDNDDIALPNLARVAAVHTEPYASFCARERQFDVLAQRHRYWLLAQLAADGAQIVPVGHYDRVEVFRVSLR